MESAAAGVTAGEGGRQGEEDEVARLRREKAEADAALARVQDELRRAWEEMQEAWELREDEEERLRRLLARLEERNADLELRDKELRGDLSRLADAEKGLAQARLLQKLIYHAQQKGFLNDEEADDEDDHQRVRQPSLPPELLARQQELSDIEAFVQRKRQERAARDGGQAGLNGSVGDPPPLASSGVLLSPSSSTASSVSSSLASSQEVGEGNAGSVTSSAALDEPKQAPAAIATGAQQHEETAGQPHHEGQAEQKKGSTIRTRAGSVSGPTANQTPERERGEGSSSGGGGGSVIKGRVTKAELAGASKAVVQPPPTAHAAQRGSVKKVEIGRGGTAPHQVHQQSGPAAQPLHHSSGGLHQPPGVHHPHHGQHGQHGHHGQVKHHPTTLKDLFVAAPTPSSPPEAVGSPRGHSRSRSVGYALAGIVAGAVPADNSRAAQVPQPPPLPLSSAGKPEKKSSKIEREIDEYCGQGLNEDENEDEMVPVATHRLVVKLREDKFFVPTTNRAYIKTCNTLLVGILKAISSCVKMSKRDVKTQAFWLSYTTSFICLLKQETKGKLEGMRQIRNPRKHGLQLVSPNKLIKKITSMPDTSNEYIVLSRRIEICGFVCKLLHIAQRVYANLLRLITKQLEPVLVPVVFYHERGTGASPFTGPQPSLSSSTTNAGSVPASRSAAASPVREHVRPIHSGSMPAFGMGNFGRSTATSPNGGNTNPGGGGGGGGLPRSNSSSFLSALALPLTNLDYSCTKTVNDVLLVLSRMFYDLMSNNVYSTIVQQFFSQTYHVMDAALFNHLIDNARSLATVANALAVKSMLSQLTAWRRRTKLLHRKSKQLAHIREALNVLSISKTMLLEVVTSQVFAHLNDLQILHLLVNFHPDELAPEAVPAKVKVQLQERSQQSAKDMSLHIDPALMFAYKRKKPQLPQPTTNKTATPRS